MGKIHGNPSQAGATGRQAIALGPGHDRFHYFDDQGKAIAFMRDMQERDGVEITALMVINAEDVNLIIVQPWEGNTEKTANSWNKGVVLDEGFKRMVLKGVEYKIKGSVHTHPKGGSYEGPSGPGNTYEGGHGDYGVFSSTTGGVPMFIIGPTEVSKLDPRYPFKEVVWSDEKKSYNKGNRHKIGSTEDFMNGNCSLFDFLRC